jgi:hypothetical protein
MKIYALIPILLSLQSTTPFHTGYTSIWGVEKGLGRGKRHRSEQTSFGFTCSPRLNSPHFILHIRLPNDSPYETDERTTLPSGYDPLLGECCWNLEK